MTSVADRHVPIPKSEWPTDFLSMLPTIRKHTATAFRYLNSEAREEANQDAIADAMLVYARLVQLKKADLAYPAVVARYAVAQVKRQTGLAMRNHSFVC